MKELSLVEIQQVELGILSHFAAYCDENGLRYSLGGGTLLGAIRHNGFIPWDDDIDVMMPRPDYDRFINEFRDFSDAYKLFSHERTEGYYGLSSKLADSRTTIVDEVLANDASEIGVSIDVFPIDGLGDTKDAAIKAFNSTSFQRELLNASRWKNYSRSKTHGILLEPVRFFFYLLSRKTEKRSLIKKIELGMRKYDFELSGYAGCICGSYRKSEIMKKETFTNYLVASFEACDFKIISNYDEYLRLHYGDYMQLPPEEKQKTHHTYRAFLK